LFEEVEDIGKLGEIDGCAFARETVEEEKKGNEIKKDHL